MTSKSRSPGYVRKWLISTQGAEAPVGGQTIFVGNAICIYLCQFLPRHGCRHRRCFFFVIFAHNNLWSFIISLITLFKEGLKCLDVMNYVSVHVMTRQIWHAYTGNMMMMLMLSLRMTSRRGWSWHHMSSCPRGQQRGPGRVINTRSRALSGQGGNLLIIFITARLFLDIFLQKHWWTDDAAIMSHLIFLMKSNKYFYVQMCPATSRRSCSSGSCGSAASASTSWTPWPTSRGRRSRGRPWTRLWTTSRRAAASSRRLSTRR